MANRVKVFEDKKKGLSLWAWLIPLLLLLALLIYFLTRPHTTPAETSVAAPATATAAAMPNLGSVHFDTNKATLTPDGQATLQRAASVMKSNPNIHLRLEGFTDSTGSAEHNESLSDQRAETAANYLAGLGISRSRLTGSGFGADKPIDNNDTTTGKADNRRVELFTQR